MKRKTKGLDLKVPAQAMATIIVFVASKFGLDIDVATSGAIAVVLGFIAGVMAPAPETEVVNG